MSQTAPFSSSPPTHIEQPSRRRRWLLLGIGVVVIVVAGAGYFFLTQDDASGSSSEGSGPASTTEVTRGTISDTRSFGGTLGHGEALTVTNAGQGVVTRLADQGTPIEQGTELYRLNEHPVVSMFGEVPMYRDLHGSDDSQVNDEPQGDHQPDAAGQDEPNADEGSENGDQAPPEDPGESETEEGQSEEEDVEANGEEDQSEGDAEEVEYMSGADVAQLIDNLTALGYADCESVDEFTPCVEEAVRAWQTDLGVPETGIVARTDIVFLPEGGQVDTIHAHVGNTLNPGMPVLDITGLDLVVSLELPLRDRDFLSIDSEVTVSLPGGTEVSGSVTSSNVVPAEASGAGGGSGSSGDVIAAIEVTLDETVDSAFLGAPADVLVDVDERTDVLVVPVSALVAMTGGGHGLEVVSSDDSTRIVPVETGLFAAGLVEVSGDGIEEGMIVGVAGR